MKVKCWKKNSELSYVTLNYNDQKDWIISPFLCHILKWWDNLLPSPLSMIQICYWFVCFLLFMHHSVCGHKVLAYSLFQRCTWRKQLQHTGKCYHTQDIYFTQTLYFRDMVPVNVCYIHIYISVNWWLFAATGLCCTKANFS